VRFCWREYLSEWFAAYSLLVAIVGAGAKLAVIVLRISR
jgi:hypothetical protein